MQAATIDEQNSYRLELARDGQRPQRLRVGVATADETLQQHIAFTSGGTVSVQNSIRFPQQGRSLA